MSDRLDRDLQAQEWEDQHPHLVRQAFPERDPEDFIPASGLWYGADVLAKASRGDGSSSKPAPRPGSSRGAGDSDEREAA